MVTVLKGQGCRAIIVGMAITLLAGCGGAQPPIGAPGVMPQGRAVAAEGDLIYALSAQREGGGGYIIAYPSGDVVGYFGFGTAPQFYSYGICSDTKGNVFVTVQGASVNYIYKYAHGGTSPIATLVTGNLPIACSVDPSTGNLAVVNYPYVSYEANIAIYRHASGTPHLYHDPSFAVYTSCSYDNRGNLYVVGSPPHGYFALAELPRGDHKFTNISLNRSLGGPGSVQWDGGNLTVQAQTLINGQPGRYVIHRIQVSGSKAKIVGTTRLKDWRSPVRSTILRGAFVAVYGAEAKSIGYWRYPNGGRAYHVIKGFASARLGNLTISVAPSR